MGAAIYSYYTTGELKSEGSSITEGIGQGRITENLEGAPIDVAYQIPDEEALPIIFDLLEHEGLCLGGSSGINVAGAIRLAKELGPGPHHRHHARRLRHALSIEAVQSGIPAREEPAGAGLARAQIGHQSSLRMNFAGSPALSIESRTNMLRTEPTLPHRRRAAGSYRPNGSPSICAIATSSWSTAPISLPTQKRDAQAEYRAGHIPGAVFFDIDAIADHSTDLPHMLPGPTQFGEAVGALGIGDGDTIVVYDSARPLFGARGCGGRSASSAPRTSTSSTAACRNGKPKAGRWRPATPSAPPRQFNAEMNVGAVATLGDVRMALTDDSAQIVDARSAERFRGEAPEPRPGLRSGHMPGAFNVPFDRLVENGRWCRASASPKRFADAGVDLDKPIITSCGSGVTAAILTFALDAIGKPPKAPLRRLVVGMGRAARPPVERE